MFITKKKHNLALETLRDFIEARDRKINTLKLDNQVLSEALSTATKKNLNVIDGLSEKQIRILKAMVKGKYIYTVSNVTGETLDTEISMDSTNYDNDAKRIAAKQWGLKKADYKGMKAVRWVL